MDERRGGAVLGVLGGMGALASAEFLKSIYESCPPGPEQDAPLVAVYSDPTFPDRTEAFLHGKDDLLLARLLDALARLRGLGASRFVLCCVTLHHLLPRLPSETRSSIVSVLDVIFERVEESDRKHLLICSSGTRKLGLFQGHPAWSRAEDRILLPHEQDQARLHELILRIKQNRGLEEMISLLDSLSGKYQVASFIAGCSELHLVAKRLVADPARATLSLWVDPFSIIARDWAEGRRHAEDR